jgi:hypothetical protein
MSALSHVAAAAEAPFLASRNAICRKMPRLRIQTLSVTSAHSLHTESQIQIRVQFHFRFVSDEFATTLAHVSTINLLEPQMPIS